MTEYQELPLLVTIRPGISVEKRGIAGFDWGDWDSETAVQTMYERALEFLKGDPEQKDVYDAIVAKQNEPDTRVIAERLVEGGRLQKEVATGNISRYVRPENPTKDEKDRDIYLLELFLDEPGKLGMYKHSEKSMD